jgi:ribosomal protein L40E
MNARALQKPYEHSSVIQASIGVEIVVYCSKCGTENEEDAKHCTKCGANLEVSREERWERRAEEWGEELGRRAEEWGRHMEREFKDECFGLPHGGAILGLVLGIIILILGVAWLANMNIWSYLGPLAVIIVGILIVAGVVYGVTSRR